MVEFVKRQRRQVNTPIRVNSVSANIGSTFAADMAVAQSFDTLSDFLLDTGKEQKAKNIQSDIKGATEFSISEFQYETIDEQGNVSYQTPQFPEEIQSPEALDVINERQFNAAGLRIKNRIKEIRSKSKDLQAFENNSKALISGYVESFANQGLEEVAVQLADYGNGILIEHLTDANIKRNEARRANDAFNEIEVYSDGSDKVLGLIASNNFESANNLFNKQSQGLIERNQKNPLNSSKDINDAINSLRLNANIAMASKLSFETTQPVSTLLYLQTITRTGEWTNAELVANNLIQSGVNPTNANIFAKELSEMSSSNLDEFERELSKSSEDYKKLLDETEANISFLRLGENVSSAAFLTTTQLNKTISQTTFQNTVVQNPTSPEATKVISIMRNATQLPNIAQSFYGSLIDGKLEALNDEQINLYLQHINTIHTNVANERLINPNKGLSAEQSSKLNIINLLVESGIESPSNAIALVNQVNISSSESIAFQKQHLGLDFTDSTKDIDVRIIKMLDDVVDEDNVAFVNRILPLAKLALSMSDGKTALMATEQIIKNFFPKTDLIYGYGRSEHAPEQYMGDKKQEILESLTEEVLTKTGNVAGIKRFNSLPEGERSFFGRDSDFMLVQDPRTTKKSYFVTDQTGQFIQDTDGSPLMYSPDNDLIKAVMEQRTMLTNAINAGEASRFQIMLKLKRPLFETYSTPELMKLLKRGTQFGVRLADRMEITEEESALRREIIRQILRERGAY